MQFYSHCFECIGSPVDIESYLDPFGGKNDPHFKWNENAEVETSRSHDESIKWVKVEDDPDHSENDKYF